jgi:hypothetical protein
MVYIITAKYRTNASSPETPAALQLSNPHTDKEVLMLGNVDKSEKEKKKDAAKEISKKRAIP